MVLSFSQFDQAMPGTEHISEAQPWQQKESAFLNRPDVYVHGRFHNYDAAPHGPGLPTVMQSGDFHAGSLNAAHERMNNLGQPWRGSGPVFYHGRVNPAEMWNTPNPGSWEKEYPAGEDLNTIPRVAPGDPGRRPDQIDGWRPRHHNSYYRNEYEDKGSTSVILGPEESEPGMPSGNNQVHNFTTWREGITQARRAGHPVPPNVLRQYQESGGRIGPQWNHHADFVPSKTYDDEMVEEKRRDADMLPVSKEMNTQYGISAVGSIPQKWQAIGSGN